MAEQQSQPNVPLTRIQSDPKLAQYWSFATGGGRFPPDNSNPYGIADTLKKAGIAVPNGMIPYATADGIYFVPGQYPTPQSLSGPMRGPLGSNPNSVTVGLPIPGTGTGSGPLRNQTTPLNALGQQQPTGGGTGTPTDPFRGGVTERLPSTGPRPPTIGAGGMNPVFNAPTAPTTGRPNLNAPGAPRSGSPFVDPNITTVAPVTGPSVFTDNPPADKPKDDPTKKKSAWRTALELLAAPTGAAVVNAVGDVISSTVAANANEAAAKIQAESAQKALDWLQQVYAQRQQQFAPYIHTGTAALNTLGDLMGLPPAPPYVPSGAAIPGTKLNEAAAADYAATQKPATPPATPAAPAPPAAPVVPVNTSASRGDPLRTGGGRVTPQITAGVQPTTVTLISPTGEKQEFQANDPRITEFLAQGARRVA